MKDYGVSTWTGKSGKKYKFETYSLDVVLNANILGNYIFAKPKNDGLIHAVYIGEGVLKDRVEFRIKEVRIHKKVSDRICVMANADEVSRKLIEEDLLASNPEAYEPIGCNIKVGG